MGSSREGAASGAGTAGRAVTEGGGKYPFIFTFASTTAGVYTFPTADTPTTTGKSANENIAVCAKKIRCSRIRNYPTIQIVQLAQMVQIHSNPTSDNFTSIFLYDHVGGISTSTHLSSLTCF